MSPVPKRRKTMGALWAKYDDDAYYEDSFSEEEDDDDLSQGQLEDNNCIDSATDTTDAAPPQTMPITLTLEKVMFIEKNLDVYEKVSLIYLLCDEVAPALKQLTQLVDKSNEKLIYNWCIHQNLINQNWQKKLVEALCIIQNYQILRGLGFNKNDLTTIFLPHFPFTSLHVNKIRKALYFMAEGFDQNDITALVNLVCRDLPKKGFNFEVYNPQYLELYLLHWESIGYIKLDNLSNLCSILKQMDLLDLCESLKELTPVIVTPSTSKMPTSLKSVDGNKQDKNTFHDILDPNIGLETFANRESHISADNAVYVSQDNKYEIDPENPGVCLIINQEVFYREIDPKLQHLLPPAENKLDSRIGTEHDRKQLETTFEQFGFKTVTVNNLIHSEIPKKIEEQMMKITDESSFFVCIMSHGDEGVIYGVNSCLVSVKSIKNIMVSKNRAHLTGKPKVLILQSCQGTRCQRISSFDEDDDIVTDGPSLITEIVPPCADLFTFWATVPGFGAIRNKKTGSWFIQSLCENMKTLGDKYHFDDICTYVTSDVSKKKWKQVKDEVAMVPQKECTFRKLFYLPPIKG